MDARIAADKTNERSVAFSPFMVCKDGLPATRLTLRVLRKGGTPSSSRASCYARLAGQKNYFRNRLSRTRKVSQR